MLRRKINGLAAVAVAGWLVGEARPARAQDVALPEPVAAPSAKEGEPDLPLDVDREIDLANVVTSAAKGVTTVQEAPAIITIITADDIKARGFRFINQALSTVPGWLESAATGQQVPLPMVRGVQQAALLLHDGISMFDPWANIAALNYTMPMENIKRIEVVTGPGGVLWGANSFLGIVNVISKDAEDVNGLEVNALYGDGPGWSQDFRAYAMFGKTFFKNKLKVFQHVSYESTYGARFNYSPLLAAAPAPQPIGEGYYGAATSPAVGRSWLLNIDGKFTFGPISLYYNVPLGELHPQVGFANTLVPGESFTAYDRYAILEYKDRFWKDRFGFTAKGYWVQSLRAFNIELYPPSATFPPFTQMGGLPNVGGLHFDISAMLIQHTGVTLDADLNLPHGIRILGGGEFFYEGVSNSTAYFNASPFPDQQLPLYCPVQTIPSTTGGPPTYRPLPFCPRQFVNDASRVVVAGYVDAQWRPFQKLTLDGGVRLQKGLGNRPYDLVPLYSGAIVWNFLPDFHLKANYATGFRPPVYQNIASALGGLNYGGSPDLKTETSQSFQGEINARLLRNVRKVRELELRADYSYTFLDRVIVIRQGTYANSGKRAIHSVEAYAKLYLAGDHFLQASYTYLNSVTSDSGTSRGVPNHWFTIGGTFNVIKSKPGNFRTAGINPSLDFNFNLTVLGAYEDPNRYVSSLTGPKIDLNRAGDTAVARTTDLAFDRLTPVALLQLGVRLRFLGEKLAVSGQFYNVLNQRYYYPDEFYDLTPSTEMTPTPAPGFSGLVSVTYHP
ncbi:MAG TPA: TonB-dependent receptor [Polyangia bacterium]|nr:TonB-dependent receptor [Polyangia bacterium]